MPVHYLTAIGIQLIGLHTLLFHFSWEGLALVVLLQLLVCGLGVDVGYHRLLSHRSFRVPRWVEYLLTLCGALALQGDPIEWVCIHRLHHRHTDRPGDPHDAGRSFFHAHFGWVRDDYFPNVTEEKLRKYCPRLWRDPFHQSIHRFPLLFVAAYFLALYAAWGVEGLRWGVGVRYLLGNHITWGVNSFGHRFGWQAYETGDLSTNCTWMALLATGSGFHNNHHAFPRSARNGFAWWQLDPGWAFIRGLEVLGLADQVQQPSEEERARAVPPPDLWAALGLRMLPVQGAVTTRAEAAPPQE